MIISPIPRDTISLSPNSNARLANYILEKKHRFSTHSCTGCDFVFIYILYLSNNIAMP